jgi:hypothetical protein
VSNNEIKVEPLPPGPHARSNCAALAEKVEPARPLPQIEVPARATGGRSTAARGSPMLADIERDARPRPAAAAKPNVRIEDLLPPVDARLRVRAPSRREPLPASAPAAEAPRSRDLGQGAVGREPGTIVPFPGPELTVGRVGVQVAIVRKLDAGYLLIPVEGKDRRASTARRWPGRLAASPGRHVRSRRRSPRVAVPT